MDAVKSNATSMPLFLNLLAHATPDDINSLHDPPNTWSPLHLACSLGRTKLVYLLIWVSGSLPREPVVSISAYKLTSHTHPPFFFSSPLSQNGADVHILDLQRRTPLYYARTAGQQECVAILQNNGCYDETLTASPSSSDTGSVEVLPASMAV